MICWSLAVLIATFILLNKWRLKTSSQKDYFKFLFKPWKTVTFLIAATGITIAAPYSGDPTWDYFDSIVMSVLVFLSAPWTVGIIYRSFIKKSSWTDVYVAICLMLFSASWFYDGYIFWRDGVYPVTWWSNLLISSALYIAAGLLWNLDWESDRGTTFAFQWEDWYFHHSEAAFKKIIWITIPFMLFAAYSVLWFVWKNLKQ